MNDWKYKKCNGWEKIYKKKKRKEEQNFQCMYYSLPIFKDPFCVALIMYAQAAPNKAIPMIAEGVTNKVNTKNSADNNR